MDKAIEEVRIEGTSVSAGIAVGTLHVLKEHEELTVSEYVITQAQVNDEIARYKRALLCSQKELEKLMLCLRDEGSDEAVAILETHLVFFTDPVLTEEITAKITTTLKNVESIFLQEMKMYGSMLKQASDPLIQQRFLDIKDLSSRILRHLHPNAALFPDAIPSHSIVCASELTPSQTAEASPNQIRAFVTQFGGPTSHAALIAKAKGIPYVSNVHLDNVVDYQTVRAIVDGHQGLIIINPDEQTQETYSKMQMIRSGATVSEIKDYTAFDQTLDGELVEVQANLENLHELHLLKKYNTQAIGLVRSEFLYLQQDVKQFCEQEQYELYKKLVHLSGQMEVTFRIFDIGSDKCFVKGVAQEPNPALGCRSIRFLMNHPNVFSTQVRAILRASIFGNVRLLLPFVSDIDELREAKQFIKQVEQDLTEEGIPFCQDVQIGCMVEVPSFVIMCEVLAEECDFLSIGTNDLAQYTFAADRSNPSTCERYRQDHPALVRMIAHVVREAKKAGIEVSICGEIASDPACTELLLSLGIRKLSCAPRFIPAIKQAIHAADTRLRQNLHI